MSKPENGHVKKSRVFLGREAWIQHVSEFQKSGLTQPAYAKRHNLNTATFRNWVARLKKEEQTNEVEPTAFVPIKIHQPSLKDSTPGPGAKDSHLHIRLPNGIECSFPSNHAPKLILPWIEYLRVLP